MQKYSWIHGSLSLYVFPISVDIRNIATLLSGILKMFSCQKYVLFFLEIKNHRCEVIMFRLQMSARVLGPANYSSLGLVLWVRLLFEVLFCPKTYLEHQTLAPKWRLSLRTIAPEEVWCLQLPAFSRPCLGIIIALGGPLLFTLENLPVLFFGALYTSMLMGAARLRIHVLWPLVHITRPVATQKPTFFVEYFRSSLSRKPSWMSAQGFKHIFYSIIQLCPYLLFEYFMYVP